MPWMTSGSLDPPLTTEERESLAEGRAVARQEVDGAIVVCPRSVMTSYGRVTGLGMTYGPNGEDAFFHRGGRLMK